MFAFGSGGSALNAGKMQAITSNSFGGSSFIGLGGSTVINKGTLQALAIGKGSAFAEMSGSAVINSGTVLASATGISEIAAAYATLSASAGNGFIFNGGFAGAVATSGAFAELDVSANNDFVGNAKTMLASATSGGSAEIFVNVSGFDGEFFNSLRRYRHGVGGQGQRGLHLHLGKRRMGGQFRKHDGEGGY